jgi:predicted nucleic acid-binding protein
VRSGDLHERQALELLDQIATVKMRLLADRVSRRVAWKVAADLELADTRFAEYVAVAKLQADVLVTDDLELRRVADGYVRTADRTELEAVLIRRDT